MNFTSPKSVEFRKGDQAKIEVSVNTTQGYEPTVNLIAKSQSKHLGLDFPRDDTVNVPVYTLLYITYPLVRCRDRPTNYYFNRKFYNRTVYLIYICKRIIGT